MEKEKTTEDGRDICVNCDRVKLFEGEGGYLDENQGWFCCWRCKEKYLGDL